MFVIPAGGRPAAAYVIGRSLRWSPPSYLARTPSIVGNRKQFTFSFWAKRSGPFGTPQPLFGILVDANNSLRLQFDTANCLSWYEISAGAIVASVTSVAAMRDPSAWAHYVISVDTTNASKSVAMWMNGVELTQQGGGALLNYAGSPNSLVNSAVSHRIGSVSTSSSFFDGYLAEYIFIDGAIKTPSDFGFVDGTTGAWMPKQYTGAYGVNGCWLQFTDTASFVFLGNDHSPNLNHYSVSASGFNVTAGVNQDSYIDQPTHWGNTNDGVGGNYCTLNPLDKTSSNISVENGALAAWYQTQTSAWGTVRGTQYVNSGKWFFEVTNTTLLGYAMIGVMGPSASLPNVTNWHVGSSPDGYGIFSYDGNKWNNSAGAAYATAYLQDHIIGVALDLDAGTLTFYRNGVSLGVAFTGLSGMFAPAVSSYLGTGQTFNRLFLNCGQRDFQYYPLPAGHKVWCSQHIPTPTIKRGNDYMDINTRTGTGAGFAVTGKRFAPDLVWIKSRSFGTDHALYDSTRGATKDVATNQTSAETTEPQGITSLDAGGFSGGTLAKINTSGANYVDWLFKKSAAAGIDIVTFNSPPSGSIDVPHSLGVKPAMVIVKCRGASFDWAVWHQKYDNQNAQRLYLNQVAAIASTPGSWPTMNATHFSILSGVTAAAGQSNIAYVFAEVPGFSQFGSYTGNGSADGPFVWTGFLPRWLLMKSTSVSGNWVMVDTARNPYNSASSVLYAHASLSEQPVGNHGIYSNGFKLHGTNSNDSGVSYIYAAFAEYPFKYARAR